MRTISTFNRKGGLGKTITSVNVAHILATLHGKRVLIIDNDKQGNSSRLLNRYAEDIKTIAEVMTEENIKAEEVIIHTDYKNLDIITANMNLLEANKNVLIDTERPQLTRLSNFLSSVKDKYDYCIIDNAPDVSMSVLNALVASNDIIVPIKVDMFAFDGLEYIKNLIEELREVNPSISFLGCFVTMFQKNTVNKDGVDWLKNDSPYPTFDTIIRKSVKVDESTFESKPILEYSKNCTAAKDYISLVSEYLEKIQSSK